MVVTVKLSSNDISFFYNIVHKLNTEAGGDIYTDNKGNIASLYIEIGEEKGITPEPNTRSNIGWHTHCSKKNNPYPIPPSPNDMKTCLIMNCSGSTDIELLFTIEGIYAFWPTSKILDKCGEQAYEFFNGVKEIGDNAYSKIANDKTKTPEEKRKTIIKIYRTWGFKVIFKKWDDVEDGLVIEKK
jgi:hypothetical protein